MVTGDFNSVMKKLMRYTKTVTRYNTYWNNEKRKRRFTINQVGAPTILGTLSMVEFHWLVFCLLLSENEVWHPDKLHETIINNPHLLEWFLTVSISFMNKWLLNGTGTNLNLHLWEDLFTAAD